MVLAEAPRAVAAACRGSGRSGRSACRTMNVMTADVRVVVALSSVQGLPMDDVMAVRLS